MLTPAPEHSLGKGEVDPAGFPRNSILRRLALLWLATLIKFGLSVGVPQG